MTCRDALMPQSQEVKEWPGLWAVRGVEIGGSALRPVGGIYWCPLLFGFNFHHHKESHVITMKICYQMEEIHGNINP